MATPRKSAAKKAGAAKKQAPGKSARATGRATSKPAAKKAAEPKPSTTKAAPKTTAKKAATKPAKKGAAATPRTSATKSTTGKKAAKKGPAKKASTKKSTARRTPRGSVSAAAKRLEVREDEAPWTVDELDAVRNELQGDVDRLAAELSGFETEILGLMGEGGDGPGDDQADVGTKTFEREHEYFLAQNSRELLQQSRHALDRIADGSYGICENCGNPIGKMRLQAFPRATLCMSCKQKQERH